MTHVHNDRSSRQRRRAGATLVLAAATGGLLAAAMAGSPIAHADDPFTDISNDVQSSIAAGEAQYTDAATDFSTAGDTNEGLIASFSGFDNIFLSPGDYTVLGLVADATGTDFSGSGSDFFVGDSGPITAAGQMTDATNDLTAASGFFSDATTAFTGGEYFLGTDYILLGGYEDILASQADTLAGLFSLGF
jgi:hypothetical protein